MRVFVTVGSTCFDGLVEAILQDEFLELLYAKGYRKLVVQAGETKLGIIPHGSSSSNWSNLLDITVWKFEPSLLEEYKVADLIISHAGSGTILEVLRVPKPLIAVPNPSLLHNHQEELALALQSRNYLIASTIAELTNAIHNLSLHTIQPFPHRDGSKFQSILDEEMGYIS